VSELRNSLFKNLSSVCPDRKISEKTGLSAEHEEFAVWGFHPGRLERCGLNGKKGKPWAAKREEEDSQIYSHNIHGIKVCGWGCREGTLGIRQQRKKTISPGYAVWKLRFSAREQTSRGGPQRKGKKKPTARTSDRDP